MTLVSLDWCHEARCLPANTVCWAHGEVCLSYVCLRVKSFYQCYAHSFVCVCVRLDFCRGQTLFVIVYIYLLIGQYYRNSFLFPYLRQCIFTYSHTFVRTTGPILTERTIFARRLHNIAYHHTSIDSFIRVRRVARLGRTGQASHITFSTDLPKSAVNDG